MPSAYTLCRIFYKHTCEMSYLHKYTLATSQTIPIFSDLRHTIQLQILRVGNLGCAVLCWAVLFSCESQLGSFRHPWPTAGKLIELASGGWPTAGCCEGASGARVFHHPAGQLRPLHVMVVPRVPQSSKRASAYCVSAFQVSACVSLLWKFSHRPK